MKKFWNKKEDAAADAGRMPWDGVKGLTEADVAGYFSKNDAVNRDVPLAIAGQVADEVMAAMGKGAGRDAFEVARMQGMIMGVKRFADIYAAGIEKGRTWRRAGE